MSRSLGSLKRLRIPPQLEAFNFSLYHRSTSFFSLLSSLSPFRLLKRLFFKTLRYFSVSFHRMDSSFLFSLSSPSPSFADDVLSSDYSSPSSSPEPLFLVPLRWWTDANAALYGGGGGCGENKGVLYNVTSRLSNKELEMDDFLSEVESEIVLDMTRVGETGTAQGEGVSGSCSGTSDLSLALISEWMFLRAFRWHNDTKDVGAFLAAADIIQDLFSLQIRLSFSCKTDSLIIRINRKDNELRDFDRACSIFCVDSGMLEIWDFSGQTNQFFMDDRKLLSDFDQPREEMILELQVYGVAEARDNKREKMITDQCKIEAPPISGTMTMNGSMDDELFSRFKQSPPLDGSYSNACALGLTGLYNLGNTCFMNSALQCLVHTRELVDYFLGDFRKDLNFENPLGMNGKLALTFGELLRKLWAPGATPVAPRIFKSVIAGFAPQFGGYSQHDAQEFLAFLLDGLHEDLDRVKHKPYVEVKDVDGHLDEEVADEHWRNHLARNDSIIVDLCQGQYRSTLVCPVCKKLSITFDPFMYLSLPLPSTTMRKMTLTIFSTDGITLPLPVTVAVPRDGTLSDLVEALSVACCLRDDETLLIAEVFDGSVLGYLEEPSGKIDLIRDQAHLVAYRMLKESQRPPLFVFRHLREEKSEFTGYIYCKKFGVPLLSRVSNFSEGSEIRKEFLKLLNPFVMPAEELSNDYDCKGIDTNGDGKIESILDEDADIEPESEIDSCDFQFYLNESCWKEYKIEMNNPRPISVSSGIVNVFVSWPQKMLEVYDTSLMSVLPEVHKSTLFSRKYQESVSLYKCLDAFLKEEPLGPEDMWYCPSCKTHRQASKKLDLWRLPEILVIHLKRFSYNRYFRNKLETFVDFPINDFDLSNYMAHKNIHMSHHYMLYAVSNHQGGMGSGHYTAFIQHGQNRWYEFDDSNVFHISEEQIKTSSAYVLFYRRISDTVHNNVH
ncbi:ubiquitin carboxyl-terminal hydrolase 8 isoform X2 [Coffea arabica]|uniref:Ubiquitin carboxyl-terminal hydrolase n=1 Tax=Coffea arabica TaxID=13443 RepID=A0A6P6SMI1_COFAR